MLFGKDVTTFYVPHTLHLLMLSMSANKCKIQMIKYSLWYQTLTCFGTGVPSSGSPVERKESQV